MVTCCDHTVVHSSSDQVEPSVEEEPEPSHENEAVAYGSLESELSELSSRLLSPFSRLGR